MCNPNALQREAAGELHSTKNIDRDFNRVNTDYGYTLDWNRFTAFVTLTVLMSVCAFLQASNEMILSLLCDKMRHRRSFCHESHVLLIPLFLSLLLHCLMMHRLTLQPLPSPLPFSLSIYAKEPSVQSPCSRLFPQMPPSLWEYQINEIDLSFLVIYQLLCRFHACPKCFQECPATLIPVDQWCNIHFYAPVSL